MIATYNKEENTRKISSAAREHFIEIEVRKFTPKTIRSYRNNRNLFLRCCETEAQITDVFLVFIVEKFGFLFTFCIYYTEF